MTVDPSLSNQPIQRNGRDVGVKADVAGSPVEPAQRSVKAALAVAAAFAVMVTALVASTASAGNGPTDGPSPLAGTKIQTIDLTTSAGPASGNGLSIATTKANRAVVGSITQASPTGLGGVVVAHPGPEPHSSLAGAVSATTEEQPTEQEPAPEESVADEPAAAQEPVAEQESAADEPATEQEPATEAESVTEEEPPGEEEPAPAPAATGDTATPEPDRAKPGQPEPDEPTPERVISLDTPDIIFPVVGPVTYTDTWGACRGVRCSRSHKGVDIFGHKLAPMVAAADGVITGDRRSGLSLSGNMVIITGDDGWRYLYIHLNNDRPGTDDGANPQGWIVPNRLRFGDRVKAGDVIGYLGDSGNAETTPAHVHFEIHKPTVGAINPTQMVADAEAAGRIVTTSSLASTPEGRAEHEPLIRDWYSALLDREPTGIELFAWADRFDIGFANSNDLIADLTMDKARRDPAGAIVRSFRVALDRLPTLNELRLWEEAYLNGTDLEAVGKTLIESAPFEDANGALSDREFVTVLYRNAIGADPSAQRLDEWADTLADGATRASVAAHLADSYSVKNSTWHGLEVIQSYRAGLDRMPSDDEYAQWVAHLDAGGLIPDVVEGIRGVD